MKRKISKNVTRIFATVLACIMLVGVGPVAFATTDESAQSDLGLFFDMDLTAYDPNSTGSKGIFDSADDSVTEGITVTGSPTVSSITGTGIKYLELTAAEEAQGVQVADAGVNTADISMEFWTRSKITHNNATWKMLFTLASSTGTNNVWIQSGPSENAFNYIYKPNGNKYNMSIPEDTAWHHVVVTRSVTNEGTTHTRYVDGKKISGATDTAYTSTDLPTDLASYLLHIGGGSKSQSATWEGDIAVCRMYNTVLSEDTVAANYAAEVGRFTAKSSTLTITEAPEEGDTISTAGTLTMTFDSALDETTISGIRLLDGDYQDAGNASAALSADGKTVTLTYSNLVTERSYKLYIPGTVKSASDVHYSGSIITLYTEAALPTCLFDLDMSAYNASGSGAKGLTDSATDSVEETITVTGTPMVTAIAGRPVKYLSLATDEKIAVTDTAVNTAAENAVSFEMWLRRDIDGDASYQYKHFFKYGSTSSTLFDVYKGAANAGQRYAYRLMGNNTYQTYFDNVVFADDTWQHHVYTLATTGSGVELIGYIDGEKKITRSYTGTDAYGLTLTNFLMNVGGLPLDLGALRAYDGIMTEAAVKKQYELEKDNFVPIANPLELLEKPMEGSMIDATGTLNLRFNKVVRNYADIALKDADGVTVQTASVSGNGKVVTISYSNLTPLATYTLAVPNTVSDEDNTYFVGAEITLKVNASSARVFALDMSGYDASSEAAAKGIMDSAAGTAAEISVSGAPILKRITESGASYLTFTPGSDVLQAEDAQFNVAPSTQDMTIEMWAKNDGTKSASEHLILLRNVENNVNTNLVQLYYSSNNTYLKIDNTTQTNFSSADSDWEHYVLSRKYDSTTANYTWTLYLNGVKKGNPVSGSSTKVPTTLYIGAGVGYGGDIGLLNVYNTAMTADDALALYNTTVMDYKPVAKTVSYVADSATVDVDGTVAFSLQNDTTSAIEVTVLVASYDANEKLLGISQKVVPLTASDENLVFAEATHTGTSVKKIRIFVWSNLYNIQPLMGDISLTDPYSL